MRRSVQAENDGQRGREEADKWSDRVPDKLWADVRDIVQETGIKTIPMEKKCKNAKWLYITNSFSLQIAVKRREAKGEAKEKRKDIII